MGCNPGVSVQRKAVDTGTTGAFELRVFPFRAKARANPPDLFSSPLPKGDSLLDRGSQSASEFGVVWKLMYVRYPLLWIIWSTGVEGTEERR